MVWRGVTWRGVDVCLGICHCVGGLLALYVVGRRGRGGVMCWCALGECGLWRFQCGGGFRMGGRRVLGKGPWQHLAYLANRHTLGASDVCYLLDGALATYGNVDQLIHMAQATSVIYWRESSATTGNVTR